MDKDSVKVEFIRFDYDIEQAVKRLKIARFRMRTQICCVRANCYIA
jgi:hypothetical protein